MKLAGAGLGTCAAVMLAYVAIFGRFKGYWFWNFDYVATYYRFHDRKTLLDTLHTIPNDITPTAILCLVVGPTSIALGLLPPRTLSMAVAPTLAVVTAVSQQKGWKYHYIPVNELTVPFILAVRCTQTTQSCLRRATPRATSKSTPIPARASSTTGS